MQPNTDTQSNNKTKFVKVSSFHMLDALDKGPAQKLEEAHLGRMTLRSSFKSREDFSFEVACHQLKAPVAVTAEFVTKLRKWYRHRQYLTGLLVTGDNKLAEGENMDEVIRALVRAGLIRVITVGAKAGTIEHIIPNGLIRNLFVLISEKWQGEKKMTYPWKLPTFWVDAAGQLADMTMEDVKTCIRCIQAAEAEFNRPMELGPVIPFGASTPASEEAMKTAWEQEQQRQAQLAAEGQPPARWSRLAEAWDKISRGEPAFFTHHVDLKGWRPSQSVAYKLRIEVRNGRFFPYRAVEEVEASQGHGYDREKKQVLQEAVLDRHGRKAELKPLDLLPALESACTHLTDTFVRREWVQEKYAELGVWLNQSGLEAVLYQNIRAHAKGRELIEELLEDQQADYEERAKAKELAAAGAPYIAPEVSDDPTAFEAAIAAAAEVAPPAGEVLAEELVPEVAPLAGEVPAVELVPEVAPLVEAAGDDVVSEETDTTSEEEQEAEEIPAAEAHESVPA